MNWNITNIPSQQGRTVLVTGANSGIGREAAQALAANGAHVIMACRSREKADKAMIHIRKRWPKAELEFLELDLARQQSVHEAARQVRERHGKLDLLINNAGVMWVEKSLTEDGFETQFGTNHLGHFTLAALLIDTMMNVPGSRVVTVSSLAHRAGRIQFDDPNLAREYGRHRAYAQSKVANLLFALELQRRLFAADAQTLSVACHPGLSNTNLIGPGLVRQSPLRLGALVRPFMALIAQNARSGALPTLYAATSDAVRPGGYYGPQWLGEFMGPPGPAQVSGYARNEEVAARLWRLSESLTGVNSPLPEPQSGEQAGTAAE